MSVDFLLRLIDQTSGPALAAAGALSKIEAKMKAIQASTSIDLGKGLASFSSAANKANGILPGLGAFGRSAGASLATGFSGAAAAASMLGGAMLTATGAGLGLVGAGAAYAAKIATFKEDALFSFQAITGSQVKANEIMTMADELARSMGAKTSDVTDSIRELMSSGFDVGESKAIVAAQFDIKALNPKADVSGLNKALAKMQGAQKFQLEQAETILGAGVDDSKFYAILQQLTGSKDRTDLFKKISTGQVSDKEGLAAMLQAVQQQNGGGPLGSAGALKASTTVEGATSNAMASLERLFGEINKGPVSDKFIELANTMARMFDPAQPGGKRLLDLLNQVVDLVNRAFKSITPEDIVAAFEAISTGGEAVFGFLDPLLKGFGSGFQDAASSVRMIARELGLGQGPAGGMGAGLALVGQALGYIAVGVGVAVVGLGWLVGKIVGLVTVVWGAGMSVGLAIVDGITGGLDSAKGRLMERLTALAELLPDSVRKILGIHSPSRVFSDIGVNTVLGFDQGLRRGPDPSEAMAAMMEPPPAPYIAPPQSGGLLAAAAARAAAGSGGVNVSVTFERIEISGGADPEAAAEGFSSMFETHITRTFERLALSSGAGALAP